MIIFWLFCDVITPIFDEFFHNNSKRKNGEFFYYLYHSIQQKLLIIHKSRIKTEWGGECLHILIWEKPEKLSYVWKNEATVQERSSTHLHSATPTTV